MVVLYQYGQRFYQRSVGRWTQQDNLESLGDPTQGNRYTYAGGDPINNVDPSGLDFTSCTYGELFFGAVSQIGSNPWVTWGRSTSARS